MKPVTITINAFCQIFGISRTTTYKLINQGRIETIKVGRSTRITVRSAEAWFEQAVAESVAVRVLR